MARAHREPVEAEPVPSFIRPLGDFGPVVMVCFVSPLGELGRCHGLAALVTPRDIQAESRIPR